MTINHSQQILGTRIGQASECFVYWKDPMTNDTWGLNFTSPIDAKQFRECCVSRTKYLPSLVPVLLFKPLHTVRAFSSAPAKILSELSNKKKLCMEKLFEQKNLSAAKLKLFFS